MRRKIFQARGIEAYGFSLRWDLRVQREARPDPFRSGRIALIPPPNRAVSPEFVQLVNYVPDVLVDVLLGIPTAWKFQRLSLLRDGVNVKNTAQVSAPDATNHRSSREFHRFDPATQVIICAVQGEGSNIAAPAGWTFSVTTLADP